MTSRSGSTHRTSPLGRMTTASAYSDVRIVTAMRRRGACSARRLRGRSVQHLRSGVSRGPATESPATRREPAGRRSGAAGACRAWMTTSRPSSPHVAERLEPPAEKNRPGARLAPGLRIHWWRRRGSNPRPPACKAGALPTELRPRARESIASAAGGAPPNRAACPRPEATTSYVPRSGGCDVAP